MWTRFMDMYSGGYRKQAFDYLYIEAGKHDAMRVFWNRFGRDPNRTTYHCCGVDYTIECHPDMLQLTGYNRGCSYDRDTNRYLDDGTPLEEYLKRSDIRVIRAGDITEADMVDSHPLCFD